MLFQEILYNNTFQTANIKYQACIKTFLIEICNITINNGIYHFVFEIDVTQRADAGCYFIKKYSIVFTLNSKKVMKHPTSETVTIDWYIPK
jgi:hypothetical protein